MFRVKYAVSRVPSVIWSVLCVARPGELQSSTCAAAPLVELPQLLSVVFTIGQHHLASSEQCRDRRNHVTPFSARFLLWFGKNSDISGETRCGAGSDLGTSSKRVDHRIICATLAARHQFKKSWAITWSLEAISKRGLQVNNHPNYQITDMFCSIEISKD